MRAVPQSVAGRSRSLHHRVELPVTRSIFTTKRIGRWRSFVGDISFYPLTMVKGIFFVPTPHIFPRLDALFLVGGTH